MTKQAGTEFSRASRRTARASSTRASRRATSTSTCSASAARTRRNLTKDSPADDTQPAFSPDGERIAFRSEREPRGIYVMERDGRERAPRLGWRLPSLVVARRQGDRLQRRGPRRTFDANTTPSALWVVNVETGAKRLLDRNGRDAARVVAARPTHRLLVHAARRRPPRHRDDLPPTGGEAVVVTKDASTNWNPVWSPDGKYLYFASDRSGNMNFWRVRVDEETGEVLSEPEAVVTPSKFSRHLGFSRDGKRMIYVQTDNQSNIQAVEFDAKSEKRGRRACSGSRAATGGGPARAFARRQAVRHAPAAPDAGRHRPRQPRRHELARPDQRQVLRPLPALVARRQTHRLHLRPQRQLRNLDD